jgi:predicted O-linked N-acetylglucosamine transferase (SPINDLY family)
MDTLALRPAAVQIGYLGFLATTGAGYIDYLVADRIVVPESHEPFYSEKLIRMPACYQMNHSESMEPGHARRGDWGLPPSGPVLCCFNASYKIDRRLFDAWMRILHRVPDAVLWLNGTCLSAVRNMRSRAALLGIDPDRLIFAGKVPLAVHLNRLTLADLALDTVRYNGGATTANALAAGVPVITVVGRHWVSRMTASHLTAAGLPDLVCPSLEEYVEGAVNLAGDAAALKAIRQRLDRAAAGGLMDAGRFVRCLESGYQTAWLRYLDGLEPDHIDIASA